MLREDQGGLLYHLETQVILHKTSSEHPVNFNAKEEPPSNVESPKAL